MDLLLNGMERFAWLVPAACDLLALASVACLVRLTMPVVPARLLQTTFEPASPAGSRLPSKADQGAETAANTPNAEPAPRADVLRALDAIGRWERHHGSSRGITELARWVEGQRKEREAASAR